MKSTLANFTSREADGIGYDRAATSIYDARARPATVPYDTIKMAYHDYDGPNQHATVTVCRNIPTYLCLAVSDQSSGESAPENAIRFADNPINRTDPTGLIVAYFAGWPFGLADKDDFGLVAAVHAQFPKEIVNVYRDTEEGKAVTDISNEKKQKAPCFGHPVILVGYSNGGSAATSVAIKLQALTPTITVDEMVTVDPITIWGEPSAHKIPSNVVHNDNYYQQQDQFLRGGPNEGQSVTNTQEFGFNMLRPGYGPHLQIADRLIPNVQAEVLNALRFYYDRLA